MKKVLGLVIYFFFLHVCLGQVEVQQSQWYDNLQSQLHGVTEDEEKASVWYELANYYKFSRPDSAIYYGSKALAYYRSISFLKGEIMTLHYLALSYRTLGNESKSLKINLECLRLSEENDIKEFEARSLLNLGADYYNSGEYLKAMNSFRRAYTLFQLIEYPEFAILTEASMGHTYLAINQGDSALYYCIQAKDKAESMNTDWVKNTSYLYLAEVYRELEDVKSAISYFHKAIDASRRPSGQSIVSLEMAKLFLVIGKKDSAIFYANKALDAALGNNIYREITNACLFLSEITENDPVKALNYSKLALAYTDSLNRLSKMTNFTDLLDFDEQQRNYELETAQKEFQSRLRTNIFLGSTFTLVVIAFFLFRNNRQEKRSKRKVEIAYERLKNTQSQLVHAEKMASLGELTAGIAHEIQNPLNFVNNFSEVNDEMLDDLKEAIANNDQEEIESIFIYLKENENKIKHHGQRASEIVRSMLQHSRTSTGEKEPTDLNALCDEYLRLAYHGIRAKDKNFNADFKLELDETLPKVNVVPQDIGRVLLNLINNAFYAVKEQSKNNNSDLVPPTSDAIYKPQVEVSSKKVGDKIEIRVKDNGPGIPEEIREKIFQPFFTTKPTGQGTGLGLSLSYDIVKANGGEIVLNTSSTDGSQFIIKLPVNK